MLLTPKGTWQSIKSETLSWKTIINKLDFLNKTVIIQWNIRGKRFKIVYN